MIINWIFVVPLLTAIFIFFCPIIVNGRNRTIVILSCVFFVFNFHSIFSIINTLRRDYGNNLSSFPFINIVLYFIIFNGIFLLYSIWFLIKFNMLRQTIFINKIRHLLYSLSNIIFKIDKRRHRLFSLIIIFLFLYIIGFIGLYTHEFGHAIVNIIFGNYFEKIQLTLDLQGLTYIEGSFQLNTLQKTFAYLGGFISETILASIILIILLAKKEKSKFSWFLSISISMLLLNRLALYFTLPQLLNIPSDTLAMVINLKYDPWILFLIFLPYLIISFEVTFQLILKFYRKELWEKHDFLFIFIVGLISYILFLLIIGSSVCIKII